MDLDSILYTIIVSDHLQSYILLSRQPSFSILILPLCIIQEHKPWQHHSGNSPWGDPYQQPPSPPPWQTVITRSSKWTGSVLQRAGEFAPRTGMDSSYMGAYSLEHSNFIVINNFQSINVMYSPSVCIWLAKALSAYSLEHSKPLSVHAWMFSEQSFGVYLAC